MHRFPAHRPCPAVCASTRSRALVLWRVCVGAYGLRGVAGAGGVAWRATRPGGDREQPRGGGKPRGRCHEAVLWHGDERRRWYRLRSLPNSPVPTGTGPVNSSVQNRQQNLRNAGRQQSRSTWLGMPNRYQSRTSSDQSDCPPWSRQISACIRQPHCCPAWWWLLVPSLPEGSGNGDSVGIDFAVRYDCYRNLEGSYSM